MTTTIQNFTDKVKHLLSREGAPELPEGTHLQKAVTDAVIEFSRHLPHSKIWDITGDGSSYDFSLPSDFSCTDGISRIVEVEYPTGDRPATMLDPKSYGLYRSATATWKFRLADDTPSATETCRVAYTLAHTVDGTQSTIPTAYEPAIHYKAAELACLMMAAQHTRSDDGLVEAVTVDHGTRSGQWQELAGAFRKAFERAMGIGKEREVKAGWAFGERDWSLPWGEEPVTHAAEEF